MAGAEVGNVIVFSHVERCYR